MYKIKEGVNLEKLEDYNFNLLGISYMKNTAMSGEFYINTETRIITRLHPYSMREEPTENEIQMLGIANLVEKVGD